MVSAKAEGHWLLLKMSPAIVGLLLPSYHPSPTLPTSASIGPTKVKAAEAGL